MQYRVYESEKTELSRHNSIREAYRSFIKHRGDSGLCCIYKDGKLFDVAEFRFTNEFYAMKKGL
jgi:hypothetical protein